MSRVVILSLLCMAVRHAVSLEILAIVSLPLRSHYMAFAPLFKELATRGHSVTVVNNFPDETAHDNLKFVDLMVNTSESNRFTRLDEYEQYNLLYWQNFYNHVKKTPGIVEKDCEVLLANNDVNKLFEKKEFDVIFVEQFVSDCGLSLAGVKSDAPIIGITSHVLLPWSYPRLGIPFDVTAGMFYFSNAGYRPHTFKKIDSYLMQSVWNGIGSWLIHSRIYNVFNTYLPGSGLNVQQVAYDRMKMMFVYQHFSYMGARLTSPQLLEIGGIHVGTPKRLPDELDKFLNESSHGAIYVSFGSNLQSNTMSPQMFRNFLDAFKLINPIRVIWKFENDTLPPGNENVLIGKWFPQLDVLCHRNLLGFVSHGGMLSTTEAASCGVPMISIPFFGDQFTNGAAIDSNKFGLYLDFGSITAETLSTKILKILEKDFQERAKEVSTLFHDRPMSAIDSAIYWTEYVARHREAPPTMEDKYTPWYHLRLIDVHILLILFLMPISYYTLKCFVEIFFILYVVMFYIKKRFARHIDEKRFIRIGYRRAINAINAINNKKNTPKDSKPKETVTKNNVEKEKKI